MQTTLLIPTKARVVIILHLCIGLSAMLWLIGYPFMGGHFAYQSDLLLFEAVMGKSELLKKIDPEKAAALEEKTLLNRTFFQQLDLDSRDKIQSAADQRLKILSQSGALKMRDALKFAFELPPLLIAWVLLSVIVPIALLLRHRWALLGTLLIPLVTLGFVVANWYSGADPLQYSDQGLFPDEKTLVQTELHQPLKGSLNEQKAQLNRSWQTYLVKHFAHDIPSENPTLFHRQVAKGEFRFNLERLKRLPPNLSYSFWEQKPFYLLLSYLLWNCFFAWVVAKEVKLEIYQKNLS